MANKFMYPIKLAFFAANVTLLVKTGSTPIPPIPPLPDREQRLILSVRCKRAVTVAREYFADQWNRLKNFLCNEWEEFKRRVTRARSCVACWFNRLKESLCRERQWFWD